MRGEKEHLRGYVISDKGLVRTNNEDNYLLGHCLNENQKDHVESVFASEIDKWTCAAVFDGMGGVEGGEVASYEAACIFQQETMEVRCGCFSEIDRFIEKTFRLANNAVVSARVKHSTCGTTASVVVTNGNIMKVYHRGDSRVYLKRDHSLLLLSKDHTLAQLKLDAGIYHEVGHIPQKEFHQLTEYLGMENAMDDEVPYESEWIDLKGGELILICSDGLYDMCTNESILQSLMQDADLEQIAKELQEKAFENGGVDNITILLLKVE